MVIKLVKNIMSSVRPTGSIKKNYSHGSLSTTKSVFSAASEQSCFMSHMIIVASLINFFKLTRQLCLVSSSRYLLNFQHRCRSICIKIIGCCSSCLVMNYLVLKSNRKSFMRTLSVILMHSGDKKLECFVGLMQSRAFLKKYLRLAALILLAQRAILLMSVRAMLTIGRSGQLHVGS